MPSVPLRVFLLLTVILAVEFAVTAGMAHLFWTNLDATLQTDLVAAAETAGGPLLLAAAMIVVAPVLLTILLVRRYITPLLAFAEHSRIIALSNSKHRLPPIEDQCLQAVVDAINLLAERHQNLSEEMAARIKEANTAIEDERNTLAALMSKLTQGVVVCNSEGRIILYNARAQAILRPERNTGLIGLGRRITSLLDADLLRHALGNLQHRMAEGATSVLVPFVARRAGGQTLSMHLVPISGTDGEMQGYILTFDDTTYRSDAEKRQGSLIQMLLQGQRASTAALRAAIEIVHGDSDLDAGMRQQFLQVISKEATNMSQRLDTLARELPSEQKLTWMLDDTLGSDFLVGVQRRVLETLGHPIEVSAPLEPVWLRVDSFAMARVIVFLIERVSDFCRAKDFQIRLEIKRQLAALILEWTGAPLDIEALQSWWRLSIIVGDAGNSQKFSDIIERHGGATWARLPSDGQLPAIHLILPVSETYALESQAIKKEQFDPEFDFRLFSAPVPHRSIDDLPLSDLQFTVVDTETTGLDPEAGDEIVAIGAVRIVNGKLLKHETFDSLVNPQRPMSSASQVIHGISPDMLRTMPTIEQVLPRLRDFVEDTVIVGHNVAFDMRFFMAKQATTGVEFDNAVLDTLLLEHIAHPNTDDKSLEAIAARLGVSVVGRHTALGDALATAEIFLALLPMLAEKGIVTLGQARHACRGHTLAKLTQ